VRALGLDPVLVHRRNMRWLGLAAGGGGLLGLVALIWIRTLKNQVAERTVELAASNAQLSEEIEAKEVAHRKLHQALLNERELGELKNRFVSLVSHEFRTPLGITMSAVELLTNYSDKLPREKRDELLSDIRSSTLRMSGLMEQVLLLGRAEAGKIGFDPRPIDLEELFGKLVDETLSATDRRCPVDVRFNGELAGAMGDESLLRHVFSNLLSNAIKYSETGQPVSIRVDRDGHDAVVEVEDRGIGIPSTDHNRLFEAFHRCRNVGQIPGTGLGLLIVKRCVDLHEGDLRVDSEEGTGTRFTVRLPLFRPPA